LVVATLLVQSVFLNGVMLMAEMSGIFMATDIYAKTEWELTVMMVGTHLVFLFGARPWKAEFGQGAARQHKRGLLPTRIKTLIEIEIGCLRRHCLLCVTAENDLGRGTGHGRLCQNCLFVVSFSLPP
jgi:hypothetical protein